MVHAVQLAPNLRFSDLEMEKFVSLTDNGKTTETFPVVVSRIMF